MGSPKDEEGRDDNEKLHSVSVEKGFYIDQFELKQRAWKIVMNGNPSFWKDDDLPIESVSWIDAMEFCNRLTILERDKKRLPLDWSFTLPTEAQWEYACRAGSNSAFNCGDELSSDEANIDGSIQYGASRIGRKSFGTIKCGSFNPNKFGLYDMHGNVWEWCRDWYAKDNLKYTNGSIPEKGLYKVKRGGSWFNGAHSVRSAKRFYSSNKYKNQTLGFRIVLINQ